MNPSDLERLKSKLPSCPGIQGRERYFNSVVFIPLVEREGELCFVLEKRAPAIRQGGEISFPGGGFDPDFDREYVDTAIRETQEELGLEREAITVYGRLDTLVSPLGTIIDVFIGTLTLPDSGDLPVNQAEVDKILLIPVSFFRNMEPEVYKTRVEIQPYYYDKQGSQVVLLPSKELGLPERYLKPWGGREHAIYLYRAGEEIIWGITAELIRDVLRRLP